MAVAIEDLITPQITIGEKVHLLCEHEKPITGCRFNIPGEPYGIQLVPTINAADKRFQYFGRGFEFGDCGVTINNVSAANEGYSSCVMTVITKNQTHEHELMAEIKILNKNDLHLSLPKMKILNTSPLKVGQTLAAECVTKSSDKIANISWLLNDRILNGTSTVVLKKYERDKGIYEQKSILKYDALDANDNGSILKCRTKFSNHTNDFIDAALSLIVNDTNYQLVPKIGEPFDLSVEIFAFPRVLSSRWKVNKRTIYYGKATDEFSSRELQYLGNNQWNAILRIKNITEENIHFNYSLQVTDSDGNQVYNVRLDNGFNRTNDAVIDESTEKSISTNAIATTKPKFSSKFKSNLSRRTTGRQTIFHNNPNHNISNNTNNNNSGNASSNNNTHSQTERRTKYIRKQQKNVNTSVAITEMTSVTFTTNETASVVMTEANTNEEKTTPEAETETETEIEEKIVEKPFIKYENSINTTDDDNDVVDKSDDDDDDGSDGHKELNVTKKLIKNLLDIRTKYEVYNATENSTIVSDFNEKFENFFITTSFTALILVIIVFSIMLCHYRRQVSVLKTEIIQMNLENYYNQSCFNPPNFNDYSPTSIQRTGVPLFYDKNPLNDDSDTSSNFVQTYNTNSHLYQSIDDIDTHVYDEIINTMELGVEDDENSCDNTNVDEKLNNYENNESLNSKNIFLIILMTFFPRPYLD